MKTILTCKLLPAKELLVRKKDGEKVVSATLSKHQGLNGIFVVWAASFEGVLIVILIGYHEDRFGH